MHTILSCMEGLHTCNVARDWMHVHTHTHTHSLANNEHTSHVAPPRSKEKKKKEGKKVCSKMIIKPMSEHSAAHWPNMEGSARSIPEEEWVSTPAPVVEVQTTLPVADPLVGPSSESRFQPTTGRHPQPFPVDAHTAPQRY